MSERKGDPVVIAILAVVGLALVAVFLFFWGQRDDDLGREAIGFEGLVNWLDRHDIEARRFRGGGVLTRQNTGLRIHALHDDDLTTVREEPETDLAYILQTSEIDQYASVVREKIRLIDTMIVLPKWRSGMRLARVGHELLLIPSRIPERLLDQIGLDGDTDRESGFRGFDYEDADGRRLQAAIFWPQTLSDADACEPVIGTRREMLLADCDWGRTRVLVLADPDLLNNQGLRLGDNAEIALDLIRRYADGLPVLYDTTLRVHAHDPDAPVPERRDRSWEELARMLDWPFTVVWAAAIALAALVLWRSWVRYGPPARPMRDGLRAAKEVSIAAKGRLLRLSGHDTKLLESWAEARCQRLAAEILGPHRPAGTPAEQVAKALGSRDPELAREFEGARQGIARGSTLGEGDLVRRLDRFEKILERVLDEFGRPATALR